MRILVLSDSHGFTSRLGTVLMKAESTGKFDYVVHLGDGNMDMKPYEASLPPLYATPGNCDWDRGTVFTPAFDGVTVLMTHGHAFSVKSGLYELKAAAIRAEAKAALFGHTHRSFLREEDGVLLMNPGAAMDGHFAVLTIEKGAIRGELF